VPEEKFPKSPQDIDLESAGQKLLASLPSLNKVSKERRFQLLQCVVVFFCPGLLFAILPILFTLEFPLFVVLYHQKPNDKFFYLVFFLVFSDINELFWRSYSTSNLFLKEQSEQLHKFKMPSLFSGNTSRDTVC